MYDIMDNEFGLVHYNYKAPIEEFLLFAREAGFKCTELQSGDVWNSKVKETFEDAKKRAEKVRTLLDENGIRASAVAPQNDFVVPDKESMTIQVDRMRKFYELTKIVGAPMLRIDGGYPKDSVSEDRQLYIDLIVEGIQRCLEFTEKEGMYIALDNHGMITNDGDLQVEIIERIGSKYVYANIDTMNYRWAGYDLETIKDFYKKVAPYAIHTHMKDGIGAKENYVGYALGEGEIPLEYAIACLKSNGYKGPWLVEFEGTVTTAEESAEGFRKSLNWLKQHV